MFPNNAGQFQRIRRDGVTRTNGLIMRIIGGCRGVTDACVPASCLNAKGHGMPVGMRM